MSQYTHFLNRLLEQLSTPFLIFSTVLFSSLGASQAMLLPKLTQVEVSGQERSVFQLESLAADLAVQVEAEEAKRNELFTEKSDKEYGAVMELQNATSNALSIHKEVTSLAKSFDAEGESVVVLTNISVDPLRHILTITGDVRNVGPQSLTVLASFRAELEKLSSISRVQPGTFERLEDSKIGPHSPLSITATLK